MNYMLIATLQSILADFKSVKKKFIDQGIEDSIVDEYIEEFKKQRNRIKELDHKNIDNWGKKDFKEFQEFIDNLKEQKSKTQEKKLTKQEGAELVAENDSWKVMHITSHKAAMLYGKDTRWCITEKDGYHWKRYYPDTEFYFILAKTKNDDDDWYKIAAQITKTGRIIYWDAEDVHTLNLPYHIKNTIPKFQPKIPKITREHKRLVDLVKSLEKYIAEAKQEVDKDDVDDAIDSLKEMDVDNILYFWRGGKNEKKMWKMLDLVEELDRLCTKNHISIIEQSPYEGQYSPKGIFHQIFLNELCEISIIDEKDFDKDKYIGVDLDTTKLSLPKHFSSVYLKALSPSEQEFVEKLCKDSQIDVNFEYYEMNIEYDPEKVAVMLPLSDKFDGKIKELEEYVALFSETDAAKIDDVIKTSSNTLMKQIALTQTPSQDILKKSLRLKDLRLIAARRITDPVLIDKILNSPKIDDPVKRVLLFQNKNVDENILKQVLARKIDVLKHLNYQVDKDLIQLINDVDWLKKYALGNNKKRTDVYHEIFKKLLKDGFFSKYTDENWNYLHKYMGQEIKRADNRKDPLWPLMYSLSEGCRDNGKLDPKYIDQIQKTAKKSESVKDFGDSIKRHLARVGVFQSG